MCDQSCRARLDSAMKDFSYEFLVLARTDSQKQEQLLNYYLPLLRRWIVSRLPRWTLKNLDVDKIVRPAVLVALQRMTNIRLCRVGQFQILLRKELLNHMNLTLSRLQVGAETVDIGERTHTNCLLEERVGREGLSCYDGAFQQLPLEAQETLFARIELGLSYAEAAAVLGLEVAESRATVSQSLVRLAEEMCNGSRE